MLHQTQGGVPSLHVVHPRASVLAEDIYAGRGQDGTWWFWWSWAERIGVSEDLDFVAARVARVLAATRLNGARLHGTHVHEISRSKSRKIRPEVPGQTGNRLSG